MKPVGDNQASASLLVVGHGLSLGFAWFALHLTAAGCRIFADEMELSFAMPDYGRLLMSTDRAMQTWWFLLAPLVAFALWLDWRIGLRLLGLPKNLIVRLWAYSVFVLALLNTALCVMWFRWWLNWMLTPFGMPS